MQAIILASGIGKRLRPLTETIPKCLIEINGTSILGRIVDSLTQNNIKNIIITTGYLGKKIREYMNSKFPTIYPKYVENTKYNTTNYIYSLWLTRNYINNHVITLHGDLVYDVALVKKIVESKKSSVLINKEIELPEKDFKAKIKNNLIQKIGVNIFGDDVGFCMPIYKFIKKDWDTFIEEINCFIANKKVNCYAENALNNITNKIELHPLYYNKEFAMEIDDFEDLQKAKNLLKGRNF